MKSKSFWVFMLVLSVFLVACTESEDESAQPEGNTEHNTEEINNDTDNDTNENESDKENNGSVKVLENVAEIPQVTNGFIQQQKGPYAGVDVRDDHLEDDVMEDVQQLEPLPENASEEELNRYFDYLYSLVAEDFPDPQDTIKKWEFGSFGNPDLPDSRYHFKENYNVEVLLDASGSMGTYIGEKTMMQIAKESINDFMKQVPEEANVSFRVYGHKGTGSDSDKKMSCEAIEQVYGYAPYKEDEFQKELDKIEPAGWTPLSDALKKAKDSLSEFDAENNTNLIYVVSDGVETCGGDPVKVAESLSDSNAQPIMNIIGFNIGSDAQKQLKEMADASGGVFATANNQDELEEEFNRAEEVLEAWEDWKDDALRDLDHTRVENSFDITSVSNEWGLKNTEQYNNLSRLTRIFEDEGIINREQRKEFYSKRNDVRDSIDEAQEEVVSELENISATNIEETKKSIKEKYDNQTEN
ncbi:hypothetical protein GCM10007063_10610 [Lentibacillus kapialis]|uniref:VWFA domain-containing protein n=1 Tax=Lentibacillus kapialis TaxID=340214 RepID=A0A917UWH5_9BACI|nr:VWA domain-containing protein [Lentibacillus kapialis]GGJ89869.1 hypothetical protein GCM10007063_10610 [Lentibacillus kapialis]